MCGTDAKDFASLEGRNRSGCPKGLGGRIPGGSRNQADLGAKQYLDSWRKATRVPTWLSRFVIQQI